MKAGYAGKMMLEVSPDNLFGVLSPANKGNEINFALQYFSHNRRTFLHKNLCELYNTGFQPLECRYCHHTRKGKGKVCHMAIEKEWTTTYAKIIIIHWGNLTGFWEKNGIKIVEK